MKLWQKDSTKISKEIESFTIGKDAEMDLQLAQYDVLGSIAHGIMLEQIGLLSSEDLKSLLPELKNILVDISNGNFSIESGVEDVHSQVELLLTRKLGDTGKKIHSGRSRNDQVLVDLKLFFRDKIHEIVDLSQTLFASLQSQSEINKDFLLPGYTHFQIAMPSSFGLWFGAYAEALIDDLELYEAAYRLSNKNPLGSGAGYGSSFPLNRSLTTSLLGFENLHYNVVYAQMSRGKTEQFIALAISQLAATIGRFAMDVCLFNSQNFDFIVLEEEFTTGSSIMPHKKNPDVAELLRGKCNILKGLPNTIALLLSNLPSGYHREMQLLKEVLFPAIIEIKNCLEMANLLAQNIKVKKDILSDKKYDLLFSVEKVNELVINGVPFRDAYKQVGNEINEGKYIRPDSIEHTHEGSIGNLQTEEIKWMMDKVIAKFEFERTDKAIQNLLNYELP
ncbi:MAG: argininosuccinate lyase [Bacteroidota bacterium]